MTNQLQTIPQFNSEQVDLIKRTIARDATPDELAMFFHQCNKTGLDPIAKQIYFVKYAGKVSVQTAIDGYYLIAHRSGAWMGNKTDLIYDEHHNVIAATCTVKKLVSPGNVGEFSATCLMKEFRKDQGLWKNMPSRMLEKCAESAALRKAFPNELSGTYTREEMQHEQIHIEEKKSDGFNPNDATHVVWLKKELDKQHVTDIKLFAEISKRMKGKNSSELNAVLLEMEIEEEKESV